MEHPAKSKLWPIAGLPEPGARDCFGGWTLEAPQFWWGHRAEKWTRFYVVGVEPENMPAVPMVLGEAPCVIGTSSRRTDGSRLRPGDAGYRPEVTKREREATPPALAAWLLSVAERAAV